MQGPFHLIFPIDARLQTIIFQPLFRNVMKLYGGMSQQHSGLYPPEETMSCTNNICLYWGIHDPSSAPLSPTIVNVAQKNLNFRSRCKDLDQIRAETCLSGLFHL